jgi:hypothetical protein
MSLCNAVSARKHVAGCWDVALANWQRHQSATSHDHVINMKLQIARQGS